MVNLGYLHKTTALNSREVVVSTVVVLAGEPSVVVLSLGVPGNIFNLFCEVASHKQQLPRDLPMRARQACSFGITLARLKYSILSCLTSLLL